MPLQNLRQKAKRHNINKIFEKKISFIGLCKHIEETPQNVFIILIVKKIHNIFIFIMIKNNRVLEHSRVFQNPISF